MTRDWLARYTAGEVCRLLAHAAGLADAPGPCAPRELVSVFTWERVRRADVVARWDGGLYFEP